MSDNSADPMFLRYAEGPIREALANTRVVAISSPRHAGKTTRARKIAGRKRTFLILDDAAVLASARRNPTGPVRSLDTAVIDEIQPAPELLLAIKPSVYEDSRPGRFLITGSTDLQAIRRTQDSLAGRIEVVPLLPLAQVEILGRERAPRPLGRCGLCWRIRSFFQRRELRSQQCLRCDRSRPSRRLY